MSICLIPVIIPRFNVNLPHSVIIPTFNVNARIINTLATANRLINRGSLQCSYWTGRGLLPVVSCPHNQTHIHCQCQKIIDTLAGLLTEAAHSVRLWTVLAKQDVVFLLWSHALHIIKRHSMSIVRSLTPAKVLCHFQGQCAEEFFWKLSLTKFLTT